GAEPLPRPDPGELFAALRDPDLEFGKKSFTRGQKPDDLDERLEEALQHAAAAAARAALTPPPAQIVDVHYFVPKLPPVPRSLSQSLLIATDRPADRAQARPWWRSAQVRVAAGALALFVGSAALGSVLFRPATEGQAPAAAARPAFSGLPEWLAPRA